MPTGTIANLSELLSGVHGGYVLDVATGRGGFTCLLTEHLADFQLITGVDNHRHALLGAYAQCLGPMVRFLEMDVTCLGFQSDSFDMVCVSASLHHLSDPAAALHEARRVLRPNGRFLLVEMHGDAEDEPQRTAIMLHQWAADVDAARGIYHRHTYRRQDLVDLVAKMDLSQLDIYDLSHGRENPHDPKTIERLTDFIDDHLQSARGSHQYPALLHRWTELHARIEETGVRREPVVAFWGHR